MVSKEEIEDTDHKDFQYLISKLNLDENTASQAWASYEQIRSRYTLEGEKLHWLGCAVFVACRNSSTPTLGQAVLEGNCVSLTSLLRYSNLSLVHFFNKIKSWADMMKMPDEFHKKIENLQDKVAIAFNIFKKYTPVFTRIFNTPTETENRQHRNRKQKPPPCSPTKIFEFCWLMFITAKGEDDSFSEDLVSSLHLLHVCCDLAFKNALLDDRRDLLNPSFSALPEDFSNSEYKVPKEAPCIVSTLCDSDGDILTDAMYIKEYKFTSIIKDWFDRGVIQGNKEDFTGIFDPSLFDMNFKKVTREYEVHLLKKGGFDERIFFAEHRRQLLLKEQGLSNGNVAGENVTADHQSPRIFPIVEGAQQYPNTPLTGRRFLGPKDLSDPAGSQNVAKLHNLITGRGSNPSEELQRILKSCTNDPTESIKEVVTDLSEKFCSKCAQQYNNTRSDPTEINKRVQVATTLFYKFMENILKNEKTRLQDISPLVQKAVFYECLFVCSLEIVEFSYNTSETFPWILNALGLEAFDFVKVIELTIRSGDQLPREIVKHLSWVEEKILESIIWKNDSVLFQAIENSGGEIPKFEDIALPGNMVYNRQSANKALNTNNVQQSPGPSAVESFQSPNPTTNATIQIPINTQVKKNLFPTIKPGQSLLQPAKCHLLVTDEEGNKKYVRLVDSSTVEPVAPVQSPVVETKPRKGGSLCIIFRKFYNLAGVRMDHLCQGLDITTLELKCKIWTVFEYSVRHTDLMKDRHLDQLLMCSIYIVCKVTENKSRSFVDIMKRYRDQPQADSNVYRKVLLSRDDEEANNDQNNDVNRGDLIMFYNNVFVVKMKTFALKFSSSNSSQSNGLSLSPIPSVRSIVASPRQQISKNVFIKAYESPTNTAASGRKHNYFFSRSASKDLLDINNAINTSISGKRLLDNFDDLPSKRIRNVATLVEERRVQSADQE